MRDLRKLYALCLSIALLLPAALLSFHTASAIEITDTNVQLQGDFVLEPAKLEVVLQPGESVNKSISVVNRLDKVQTFRVEIEDFIGSKDPKQTVLLLGSDQGPYSLKNNIDLDTSTFVLEPRQRAVIPITISVPATAEPGGKYASVLVSTESDGATDTGAKTISRIGALFLVRVAGPVDENGKLTDFSLADSKSVRESGPFNFELLYENNGSVHLVPHGTISIKNLLGRTIQSIDVPAFFSLPDSLRAVQVSWDPGFSFGRYTATAQVDRGYKESPEQVDELSVTFWVLPWKIVGGLIALVIIVVFIIRFAGKHIEIKRK